MHEISDYRDACLKANVIYGEIYIIHMLYKTYVQKQIKTFLRKATCKFERPNMRAPPVRNTHGSWAKIVEEKAKLFAQHLA